MSSGRNNAGFTLIEMLVSLTIIAAILAMVYGSFTATTRSINASTTRLADTERACFVLRLMARQIRCAYAPDRAPVTSGSSKAPPEAGAVSGLGGLFRGDSRDPQGQILSFLTSTGLGTGPDAPRGLFHVTYVYDRSSSTLSISRRDPAAPPDDRAHARRRDLLLRNVSGIELEFHDGRQWQRTWETAQRHELPRAVKLEIAVTDEAGVSHVLRTGIPIVQQTHPELRSVKQTVATGQL
jgi:prepilin-type N-terminal cleavage/methylation domain-containing protein